MKDAHEAAKDNSDDEDDDGINYEMQMMHMQETEHRPTTHKTHIN